MNVTFPGIPETSGVPYRLLRLSNGGVVVRLVVENCDDRNVAARIGNAPVQRVDRARAECWVGELFDAAPSRLMILSESFYDRDGDLRDIPNPTAWLVKTCALKHTKRISYYRKLYGICTGKAAHSSTENEIADFWKHTALAHFVPASIGLAARIALPDAVFGPHVVRACSLVRELKPKNILVPSYRLWHFLVATGVVVESEPKLGSFHHFDGIVRAAAIKHPSSSFAYSASREVMDRLTGA